MNATSSSKQSTYGNTLEDTKSTWCDMYITPCTTSHPITTTDIRLMPRLTDQLCSARFPGTADASFPTLHHSSPLLSSLFLCSTPYNRVLHSEVPSCPSKTHREQGRRQDVIFKPRLRYSPSRLQCGRTRLPDLSRPVPCRTIVFKHHGH